MKSCAISSAFCSSTTEHREELLGNLNLEDKRQRITEVVSHGLIRGKGSPVPGELCLEAAICLALGLPHGDAPPCVAEPDRQFAIGLNDADWSLTPPLARPARRAVRRGGRGGARVPAARVDGRERARTYNLERLAAHGPRSQSRGIVESYPDWFFESGTFNYCLIERVAEGGGP